MSMAIWSLHFDVIIAIGLVKKCNILWVEFAEIKHLIRECSPLKTMWAHSWLRFPKKKAKKSSKILWGYFLQIAFKWNKFE
jgi:hypothetical protein